MTGLITILRYRHYFSCGAADNPLRFQVFGLSCSVRLLGLGSAITKQEYGGVEVKLHAFLTSAAEGDE
jgi:hypothetical protein